MSRYGILTAMIAAVLASGAWVLRAADEGEAPPGAPPGPPAEGERDDGHRRGRWRGLTDEQEAELLAFLKEKRPEQYKRLAALKERRARFYRMVLHRAWRDYSRWKTMPAEMQSWALQEHDSRVEVLKLLHEIRNADSEQRQKLKDKLREAVRVQLKAEHKMREYRLAKLEERLKALREELKQRAEKREELVSERFERYWNAAVSGEFGRHGPHRRHKRPRPPSRPERSADD